MSTTMQSVLKFDRLWSRACVALVLSKVLFSFSLSLLLSLSLFLVQLVSVKLWLVPAYVSFASLEVNTVSVSGTGLLMIRFLMRAPPLASLTIDPFARRR